MQWKLHLVAVFVVTECTVGSVGSQSCPTQAPYKCGKTVTNFLFNLAVRTPEVILISQCVLI